MQLGDSILDFQKYLEAYDRSPNTARAYSAGITRFLRFCGENSIPVDSRMPVGTIQKFSEYLLRRGASTSSVTVWLAGTKKYLAWLNIYHNQNIPLPGSVDLPKGKPVNPESLQISVLVEFFKIVAASVPYPAKAALLLAPFVGLRGHELVNVKLSDIRHVNFPGSVVRETQGFPSIVVLGKGGKYRWVPILKEGMPYLLHYIEKILPELRKGRKTAYLFPSKGDGRSTSNHLTYRSLAEHTEKVARKLRHLMPKASRKFSLHTLRRVYANTLHRSGVDVLILQTAMGHASLDTTRKHYVEVRNEAIASGTQHARLFFAEDMATKSNFQNLFQSLDAEDDE